MGETRSLKMGVQCSHGWEVSSGQVHNEAGVGRRLWGRGAIENATLRPRHSQWHLGFWGVGGGKRTRPELARSGVSLISSRWVRLSDGAGWQTKIGPAVAVVGVSVEVGEGSRRSRWAPEQGSGHLGSSSSEECVAN